MKRTVYLLGILVPLALSCAKEQPASDGQDISPQEEQSHSDLRTIKVKFDAATAQAVASGIADGGLTTKSAEVNSAVAMTGVVSMERLFPYAGEYEERTHREGLDRWYIVVYDGATSETKAKANFAAIQGVEEVQGARKIKRTAYYNDTYYSYQWDMYDGKTPTYSINVEPVWRNYTTGSQNVIVGVVDGGIDLSHEDLADNCIAGGSNGSRNFINNSYNITAEEHGTHVAGTIAAVGNNGKGVAGVAGGNYATGSKGVRLMSCQIFDSGDGSGDTERAIKWAADHGAVIVNNSWGYSFDANDDGYLTGDELTNALNATIDRSDKAAVDYFIKYAGCDNSGNQLSSSPMKGGVVIFAAGNDGIANGAPANYEPVIAVGATTRNGTRASYSCYGDWVDICAPGGNAYYTTSTDIWSTVPNNKYDYMAGTSMACPHVTGVAALIVSHFGGQGFTADDLKERLLGGANPDVISTSSSRPIGPLVDAMGSFSYSSHSAPAAVEDFDLSSTGNVIDVSFAVTASDDGAAAYSYIVAVSKDESLLQSYDPSASSVSGITAVTVLTDGKSAGDTLSVRVRNLDFSTSYYVAVIGSTWAKAYSGMSPVKSVSTKENGAPVVTPVETPPYTIKAAEVRPLAFQISDPEDHSVTVSVDGGSSAATYEYSGSTLTITLRGRRASEGTYTATITATDSYGAQTAYSFGYTILPNHPPVVSAPFEDVLTYSRNDKIELDMTAHFYDEDEEQLSYHTSNFSASASGCGISFDGDKMIMSVSNYGLYTMDVVAADGAGKECSTPLRVLVKNPSNPVEAYPNPVVDKLTIRTEGKAETNIRIVSSSGNVLYDETGEISGFEPVSFDMSSCAPGIYSVTVSYDGKKVKKNVIKR